MASPNVRMRQSSAPRARFWRRAAAYLLDLLLLAVPITAVRAAGPNPILAYGIDLVLMLAYFTVFEGGRAGQTPGKRLLAIRVLDLAGGASIGYPRGFIRAVGKYLSGLALGLGFLWMLWDGERQTWEDKLAYTVVVPADAYPRDSA